jgi:hypothetical protein
MAKKAVVPKSIAGVPVPAAVRNSSALKTVFNSPVGKKLMTDALLAAAGAAAAILLKRQQGGAKNKDLTKEVLRAAAGAVTVGLGRAALDQLQPGKGQALMEAPARGRQATSRKSAKKTGPKKAAAAKRPTETAKKSSGKQRAP